MAESKEELKRLLMKVKEESEKVGLKLNIKKTNGIMASGPITSWEIDEETMETVRDLFLMGSVQFSPSVVSNSLQHHELQHARPPCPLPWGWPPKSLQMVTVAMKLKDACFWEEEAMK